MVAPGTVSVVVSILVGVGVLTGFLLKTAKFASKFYKMPSRVEQIDNRQSEMKREMERQHGQMEEHIGNAQAGIRAVAHKVQRNGSTTIDLEEMDRDFIRGKARARDYIENDEEIKQ